MNAYLLCAHGEAPDQAGLHSALCRLQTLAFAHYEGVVEPSEDFMRWYISRPGLHRHLCQAAFAGEELVSSLFVTLSRMRLCGEWVSCGLVDTVMTHPGHRRRGLARRLFGRALEAMASAGADLSLLYTSRADPPGPAQRLYEDLGYRVRELVVRFVRESAHGSSVKPARALPPDASARDLFRDALGGREGWLDLDEALWAWRRTSRSRLYPVTLRQTPGGGAAAVCTGRLLASGRPEPAAVLSDLVLPEDGERATALAGILAAVPPELPVTVLCPHREVGLAELLVDMGFRAAAVEAAFIRPHSDLAARLVEREPQGWYVAVESVIGI
jgi:GNAT superfamily N-acetyltransferase